MKKILLFCASASLMFAFASCNSQSSKSAANADSTATDSVVAIDTTSVLGSWTTADPIDSTKTMGVKLEAGGKASSINMATLPYKSWTIGENNTVILKGTSMGNGQNIEVSDTMAIDAAASPMTMKPQNADVVYTKE